MKETMERYVWAVVVTLGMMVAAFTALVITNHSAEMREFLSLAGQGIAAVLNIYVVWRATRDTGRRVETKLDEQTEHIENTINGHPQPDDRPGRS